MPSLEKSMTGLLVLFAIGTNISTGVTSTCIVLGMLLMVAQFVMTRRLPHYDKKILYVILLYILMQGIIAGFSVNPQESFPEIWANVYRMAPLFFALGYLRRKNQLKYFLWGFSLSVLINDLAVVYQYFILANHRPPGFNNTATFLASHLLMALPVLMLMYRLLSLNKYSRAYLIFLILLSLFALILSGTRGGWLALIGMLLLWMMIDAHYRRPIAVALLTGLICIGGLITFNDQYYHRIQSITDTKMHSNAARLEMWQGAMDIFQDHPLHGIGQGQFQYVYNTQYIPKDSVDYKEDYNKGYSNPHNNFLFYLSEGGLLGILAIGLLHGYFLYLFAKMYTHKKIYRDYLMGITGILLLVGLNLEGLTDTNLNNVPIMREYWLLVGALLGGGLESE